jgi:acylphosphatase
MTRQVCHFSGQVQGVGFRYTTARLAQGYAVSGFVRNLPDGRVELVVEGPAGEIAGLLSAIGDQMAGCVTAVERQTSPATGEFDGFSVRR